MADDKKEFEKTYNVDWKVFKEEIVDDFLTFKLSNDKLQGKHIILKIDGPIERKQYDDKGKKRTSHKIPIIYRYKNEEGVEVETGKLMMQVGEKCAVRLEEKNPNESYVGKWALCKQTFYEGNKIQFVNIMKKEPSQRKSKDELFNNTKKTIKEELNKEEITSFTEDYLNAIKEYNESDDGEKTQINFNHWFGTMMKSSLTEQQKNEYKELYEKLVGKKE